MWIPVGLFLLFFIIFIIIFNYYFYYYLLFFIIILYNKIYIIIIIRIVTACEESAYSFTAAILRLGKSWLGRLAPLAVQALSQEELDADRAQLKPEQL